MINQAPSYSKIFHVPVLLNEVLRYLLVKKNGIFVDCTVGEGGHSEAILQNIDKDSLLVGLDKDKRCLNIAEERLSKVGKNFTLINGDFLNLSSHLEKLKIDKVDGILLDFGISSLQLEDASRGFSFKNNGPLDMRFDASSQLTCEDLVNKASQSEIVDILRNFGEERRASLIARRIAQRRREEKIKTTFELSEIASKALGRGRGKIDPATRTFQAFRIAVNREIESIEEVLPQIPGLLRNEGKVCAISYHSLEDRLVKRSFKAAKEKGLFNIITKKPIRASAEEVFENPRSRSAKLRVGERTNMPCDSMQEVQSIHNEFLN